MMQAIAGTFCLVIPGTLCLALLLVAPGRAAAETFTGVVFVDGDGDGVRDEGEQGHPGVVVTNGRDLSVSDAQGRYALPEREGFVYLTRPDGFECARWYRRGSGDFALRPAPSPPEFFFVQFSDAHVYDQPSDYSEFSTPAIPWYIPQFVADWITVRTIDRVYGRLHPDGAIERLREAVAPYRDVADASDIEVFRAYSEELRSENSPFGDLLETERAAMAEVGALRPRFAISTGDLVLESNNGSAEAVERWFHFYERLADSTGIPIYETIGNNEIAGIANDDFPSDDPRYAKHFFREFFGPTYYSFDHGPFHFVALDTHRPAPRDDAPKWWDFNRMEDDEVAWLAADLVQHSDRVLVVLNHEPFHIDPVWEMGEDAQHAQDEGLFAKHGVDYALTGHIHFNSFQESDGITHITTGALSGLRWVLPAALHPRGYRLFYARGRELHSAWKETGEFVIAPAEPSGAAGRRIAVAADRGGPFREIEARLAGRMLPVKRLGDYFVELPLPDGAGLVSLTARREDGSHETADIQF